MAAAFRRGICRMVFGQQSQQRVDPRLCPLLMKPPSSQLLCCRGIASKLFVGGLSFYTTEKTLSESFSQFGQVVEATIVMDRVAEKSKGFGFVTFASEEEAQKAISEMNGKELNGRTIFVNAAKSTRSKSHYNDKMPIARGPPERTADDQAF